jgi:hypothetical protein
MTNLPTPSRNFSRRVRGRTDECVLTVAERAAQASPHERAGLTRFPAPAQSGGRAQLFRRRLLETFAVTRDS